MKISILEQNLKFSQIIGESYSRNYEERGYEIIYNPLEMLFPLILFVMMWLHEFHCIITIMIMVRFPLIHLIIC